MSLFHGFRLPVDYAGWVENVVDSTRFDRIDTNRYPCCRLVVPEDDLRETRLRAKSSRVVKCLRRIDSVLVYCTWMTLWGLLVGAMVRSN